jgi:hypothetical protein
MMIINQEWIDFEDFWAKYGNESNPDAWAQWWSVAAFFNGIGVLIKRNLLEISLVEELLSNVTDIMWHRMSQVIFEWRKTIPRQKLREYEVLHGFEYLYTEMHSRGTI